MKTLKFLFPIMLMMLVLAGCNQPTPVSLHSPTAAFTSLILLPTQVATAVLPTVTITPAAISTPGPFVPVEADVIFDNYLLRLGPGRMFSSVRMYDTGDQVTILAREPGDNWLWVITPDNYSGWMNVVGLNFAGDVTELPLIMVTNAQILHGHVWAVNKTPASKIGVGIAQVGEYNPNLQDNSPTNVKGEWYIYLPPGYKGEWFVGPNSYSCESSAVDTACALMGKFPGEQRITLPLSADVNIEFALESN